MISFWEKNSFLNYDYVIIGGGILGLSVAASIKEKDRNAEIVILEKGILPTGASTKNAGFLCFGSLTEILADIKMNGEENAVRLVEERWKGLNILKNRLGEENIDFENYGGYELIGESHLSSLEKIGYVNALLKDIFQSDAFELKNEKIGEFGFGNDLVKAISYCKFESQIDTGKMMRAFLKYTGELGVLYLTGCNVIKIENKEAIVCHNIIDEKLHFRGKKIIICTNSFSSDLYSKSGINPGRGQVIITEPIEDLRFKGVFHIDEGYYYFRNYEKRVIFGGGRNLDFESEATSEFNYNEYILNDLIEKLKNIILPGTDFKIADKWTGIMGFSGDKLPSVKEISEGVYFVHSCNGMGIALSGYMGERVLQFVKL
jgi:gamma-glutamylputrescine oxidase